MRTTPSNRKAGTRAFTLAETLISVMIMGIVFAGTILAYTRATERAEWSGYSLAAQALAMRQMEQFHAVVWDTQTIPVRDDTTNIPTPVVAILDVPVSSTNVVWATNAATFASFTNPGPSYVKMITVKTTWLWKNKVFTNTVVSYRCPDQ